MKLADIAVIGLGVMGTNLARNLAEHGYRVAVYNIDPEIYVTAFMKQYGDERFLPAFSLRELIDSTARPRKILFMIRAGEPVDSMLTSLLPLLSPEDIILDGGNSHYLDTDRRFRTVEEAGCRYIGMGVSGGAEGALHGPALMPGGSVAAWKELRTILESIAAKGSDGSPCCVWMGSGGAGHFVKMVHNGIEYGEMQLIAEIYHILSAYLRMNLDEIADVINRWNTGKLRSYLLEITARILHFRYRDGTPTLDHILDAAGQKGTGKWASAAALDAGVPLPLITEAVFARCLSEDTEIRNSISRLYPDEISSFTGNQAEFLQDLEHALFAARLSSYAQGFDLLHKMSARQSWVLDPGRIAMGWTGGCIIRASLLEEISRAYGESAELLHLFQAPYFQEELQCALPGWRRVCAAAIQAGIPIPALSSSLAYFDACRTRRLPTSLIQAQRDFFGAHGYERTDMPRDRFFHMDWEGGAGEHETSAYQA